MKRILASFLDLVRKLPPDYPFAWSYTVLWNEPPSFIFVDCYFWICLSFFFTDNLSHMKSFLCICWLQLFKFMLIDILLLRQVFLQVLQLHILDICYLFFIDMLALCCISLSFFSYTHLSCFLKCGAKFKLCYFVNYSILVQLFMSSIFFLLEVYFLQDHHLSKVFWQLTMVKVATNINVLLFVSLGYNKTI